MGVVGFSGILINLNNSNVEGLLQKNACIEYESSQKLIKVRCSSIRLTDIYNNLDNSSILGKENGDDGSIISVDHRNVWILHAGVVVEKEASLIIDSTDTSWLKIIPTPTIQKEQTNATSQGNHVDSLGTIARVVADTGSATNNNSDNKRNSPIVVSKNNRDNPNGIHVHGSLKIDSVKITSWDPEKNDVIDFDFGKRPGEEHTKSDYDTAEARAFIRVSKDATGPTNITNSELAYLGYSCSRCAGLSYYGGEGSIIKNTDIHHLLKGFYSKNAAHITIDSNSFHDNYLYGIYPHTGSHHFTISNNLVYNNNASGIICSKDCHNLIIEGNEVYNNSGAASGIAFSINTTNSVAKNNYVHDQPRCISFNRASNHNVVYNNTISNCKTGVYLSNTGNNSIYDNKISNSQNAILLDNISNNIYKNKISLSMNGIVFEPVPYYNKTSHVAHTNPIATDKDHECYLTEIADANHLVDIRNPYVLKKEPVNSIVQIEQANDPCTVHRLYR